MKKLLLCLAVACSALTANAQYYLDSSFALYGIDTFGGNIATGVIHRPQFVLPTKDNKIVIAGYSSGYNTLEMMRLKDNGTFDSTFSDTGVLRVTLGGVAMIDRPASAILYDTSKIMMFTDYVNTSTQLSYTAVLNINSNGTVNTGFGINGVASVNPYQYTTATGGGVQHDGKVVVCSRTLDATGVYKYCLNRLMPNGTPDNTYGTAGLSIAQYPMIDSPSSFATGNQANAATGCYMQDDDKLVVMGSFGDSTFKYHGWQIFLVRHNADGSPDMTFGDAGGVAVVADTNATFTPTSLAVDSAGNYYVFTNYDQTLPIFSANYAVVKFDHDGHRVTNYGIDGVAHLGLSVLPSSRISVQKDGRVIIPNIYQIDTPATNYFSVIRLNTLGDLDGTFAPGGRIYMPRDTNRNDFCLNAGVQDDSKTLVIGWDNLSATSICMRITDTTTHPLSAASVQQASFTAGIYPNPTHDRTFNLHYVNCGKPGKCTLSIFDATGKLVDTKRELLTNGPGNIPYSLPSTASPGTYYVVLTTGQNERQAYKVVYY